MTDYFSEYRDRHPGVSARFEAPTEAGAPFVIQAFGDLDTLTSPDFCEGCMRAIASVPTGGALVLKLDGVNYISSAGVGALARLLSEAEAKGVKFSLSGISPACKDVFSVLGLLNYFMVQEPEE